METWALRPASHLARSLLRHCIDKENLPPKILRTRDPLLVIRTPLVRPPATHRAHPAEGYLQYGNTHSGRLATVQWQVCTPSAAALSSILYNILQLYHQEGLGGGNVAARVEGRDQAAIKQEACSGCRVSLTTRTRSSPSLSR